jgi:hypothetical protein
LYVKALFQEKFSRATLMKLQEKLKTALDETRLLILGAQILMGFHFNGAFQDAFDTLPISSRLLHALAFLLMALTVGLLIAPSMQHRLVEGGEDSLRMNRIATTFAGAALLPFAISLGLDLFIVFERQYGPMFALPAAGLFFLLAVFFWFGAEWFSKKTSRESTMPEQSEKTPLHAKVEQMLTEARVLIPGAQALFGFQLAVMLTSGFDKLPETSKLIHTGALCCIALAIILLMAPAAFHRLAYDGEDSEEFHRLGTRFIVTAALPIAAGIAGDLYVAVAKATESTSVGMTASGVGAILLLLLWYVQPLLLRLKHGT